MNLEERFWNRVTKTDNCWLWSGFLVSGYGQFELQRTPEGKRVRIYAHRFSYEQKNGSVPEGLVLDHLCRVRNCVRPSHLEAVTSRENTMRGITGFANPHSLQTHCKHGHELTQLNIVSRSDNRRDCRTCARRRDKEYYYKRSKK
jgi:hypothetical protein